MRRVDTALRALSIELTHWPDFLLESVERGHTWSSLGPEETIHDDNWFAILKEREGPKARGHYQGNGHTMVEAVDKLATELKSRRTNPHLWHMSDWMQESRYVKGCAPCEREAADLDFDGVWADS